MCSMVKSYKLLEVLFVVHFLDPFSWLYYLYLDLRLGKKYSSQTCITFMYTFNIQHFFHFYYLYPCVSGLVLLRLRCGMRFLLLE